MKTKIVLWGVTESDEKVLVAIELVEADNLVRTHLIDEKEATEIFYNRMLNEWRYNTEMEFPEGTKIHEKQLTISEDILPDGIKVDRPDLVIRAKTEWHFVVLSKKLYDLYNSELEDFKEKIGELSDFDNGVWEELKGFWSKVQSQIREKNLFRNHVDNLRKETDEAFKQLKELKKSAEKELREESKKHFASFSEIMEKVEGKIDGGLGLQPIFEELKEIQDKFKKTNFSRDHRRQLWDRIDKSFKTIKEKRYGNSSEDRSPVARLQRRYDGLIVAIGKMEKSISRDKRDLSQQDSRAASSFGQLEMEIRKVKMSMVEERVQSKEEKLLDMVKTKTMLEGRLKNEKDKEEKKKQYEEAKKEAESKIAEEMHVRTEEMGKNEDELLKAAERISESKAEEKEEKKGIFDKISDKIEQVVEEAKEVAEDVVDTVKAVAEVVEEKVEEKMEILEEKMDVVEDKLEEKTDGLKAKFKEVVDKVDDEMEKIEDKIEEKIESNPDGIGAKISNFAEKMEDSFEDVVDKIKDKVESVMDKDEEE